MRKKSPTSYTDLLNLIGTPNIPAGTMVTVMAENGDGLEDITIEEFRRRTFYYGLTRLEYCYWLIFENIAFLQRRIDDQAVYYHDIMSNASKMRYERVEECTTTGIAQFEYYKSKLKQLCTIAVNLINIDPSEEMETIFGLYYGLLKFPYHPFQDREYLIELINRTVKK